MPTDKDEMFHYTVEHFRKVARENRFAENATIPHKADQCLICHPEKSDLAPFSIYLEVITQSVRERRPVLDRELVAAINDDLALMGEPADVTLEALAAGDARAVAKWRDWISDALDTGLALISVHSNSSLEFSVEDAQEDRHLREQVEQSIQEIMEYQKQNR